jgi:hypothetical protein
MLTDKERKDLLSEVVLALGLDPEDVTPETLVAAVEAARACQLRDSWGSIKMGPGR